MTPSPYPQLARPITLRGITLRNRSVMGSMHTGLEETGDWDRVVAFYAARAAGGAGLIVTGGIAPNPEGGVFPGAAGLYTPDDIAQHRRVTEAVHAKGGRMVLQILHAGRYAFSPDCVSASDLKSPISPFAPRALDEDGIEAQIAAIATTAAHAVEAGYDGVEVMGSEGYFINQFLAAQTNTRTDRWGADFEARTLLARKVVTRVRAALGAAKLLIFRLSLLDLVPKGATWEEVVALARALEPLGVDIFNTGIGWHEARVPTIATSVPRAAFVDLTAALRAEITTPVIASNRINRPELAEDILAQGQADFISMARPWLADADFMTKALTGQGAQITPCIACNQACLDHTFSGQLTSCLVNPRACHETVLPQAPTAQPKRIAVVGAGPAGLMAAITLAERGHRPEIFEASPTIGGQLVLAARVPGKEEFYGLLAWFYIRLSALEIPLHLSTMATPETLDGFDEIILATGIRPRTLDLPTETEAKPLDYVAVLNGAPVGKRVAIIGAGGIGFDIATYLSEPAANPTTRAEEIAQWRHAWGVVPPWQARGGLTEPAPSPSPRAITLLQRKPGKPGRGLGKTTGWIHRATLAARGVVMQGGVHYEAITLGGLRLRPASDAPSEELAVDTVVICAGQVSERTLADQLTAAGRAHHRIGGAFEAGEIDAKRAIDQAVRLALTL